MGIIQQKTEEKISKQSHKLIPEKGENMKKINNKLDKAFNLMNEKGLIARQDHFCCRTCAVYDLASEMEDVLTEGKSVKGFAYYHGQDTMVLEEGNDFHIGYGTVGEDEADLVKVGKIVVDCLEEAGIQWRWKGSADTRIKVIFSSLDEDDDK